VAESLVQFATVLRRLRARAELTQERLAEAAGLSPRAVSDLERGVVSIPHKDTVRQLADALQLEGSPRAAFESVARRRTRADGLAAASRTLPRDAASFTGREGELEELARTAIDAADAGQVVAIHAIGGMAGIGKTAFAVHAAHRLANWFPAGQIFLPLHGHTPGQRPTDPSDALASLLLMIGVPAAQIPAELEARTAQWRDRVAGQQMLLVLDDATGSEQVRPLLPGAGGSLVLVTSRRRLTALEEATAISLDTLRPDDATELLVRMAARPGLIPDDPAVAEIARLCGYLPLAIGMLARQLHHHPAWTAAGRATELAAAVNRLELLATENVSVTAAFDLSYADLDADQQRLFRRLGLHPGADIDSYAAGALDGTGVAAARRGLEALYDQHLLTELAPGRYRMHDLIREHATALARRVDSADDRDGATAQLLNYFQHAAAIADALLARDDRAAPAGAVSTSGVVPALDNRERALAWARAERANLLACLDYAAATQQYARVIALTAGMAELLRHDGPWAEAITRHRAARQAARHLGDRHGQADALTDLGRGRQLIGDYQGAVRDFRKALDIYRRLSDQLGQASALNCLGDACQLAADYRAAAGHLREALEIYRDLDHRPGQANALGSLGRVRELAGDYHGAASDLEEAREIHRRLGDRLGEANDLIFLGVVRRLTGDLPGAASDLQQALTVYRDLDYRLGQANALNFLGTVRRLTGDYSRAAHDLQDALDIYRAVGDRGGEVTALNEAGTLSRTRGDLEQATAYHEHALAVARQIGSAWDEAHALAGLARCALAADRVSEGEAGLRSALQIFQRIGAAEVTDVSAELDTLPTQKDTVASPADSAHPGFILSDSAG
jgi:tetratricopeptide (TPR) repeat protein/transcriptional regulator with XRE-family HTH domain